MLRKFLIFNLVLGVIAAIIFGFGFDEDIVYAYRDWKHDRWLTEFLKTAEPSNAPNAQRLEKAVTAEYLG